MIEKTHLEGHSRSWNKAPSLPPPLESLPNDCPSCSGRGQPPKSRTKVKKDTTASCNTLRGEGWVENENRISRKREVVDDSCIDRTGDVFRDGAPRPPAPVVTFHLQTSVLNLPLSVANFTLSLPPSTTLAPVGKLSRVIRFDSFDHAHPPLPRILAKEAEKKKGPRIPKSLHPSNRSQCLSLTFGRLPSATSAGPRTRSPPSSTP